MTEAGLGKRSLRVKCFVCEKEWFQTTERLLKTNNQHHLQIMNEDKIAEVRRTQQAMNWQSRQTGRIDKVGVFVGNLPYTFDEVNILLVHFVQAYLLEMMLKRFETDNRAYPFHSLFFFKLFNEKN